MTGETAANGSAGPAVAPWLPKIDEAAGLWPGMTPEHTAVTTPPPAASDMDKIDLVDLLKRHDNDVATEQHAFNDRLASLLNARRVLPANDRRRLNALLTELLAHRDEIVVPQPEDLPAGLIISFDRAMDGIVKSLNDERAAAPRKNSIVPGQKLNGQ